MWVQLPKFEVNRDLRLAYVYVCVENGRKLNPDFSLTLSVGQSNEHAVSCEHPNRFEVQAPPSDLSVHRMAK